MSQKFPEWKDHLNKDNEDSIVIYQKLWEAFKQCNEHSAPHLNLVAIFFHDLMKILTAAALISNELSSPYCPKNMWNRKLQRTFPYLDFNDIQTGIKFKEKIFTMPWLGNIGNQTRLSSVKLKLSRIKRNFQYKLEKIKKNLDRNNNHKQLWVVPYFLELEGFQNKYLLNTTNINKCGIPNIQEQLYKIPEAVHQICEILELPQHSNALVALIDSHIHAHAYESIPEKLPYDLVVTGTQLALEYRFMAALGRYTQIPVLSILHGDADAVYNEPWIGYGERSFSSHYIGYGDSGGDIPETEEFCKTFYDGPVYIPSNSDFVQKTFQNSSVESLRELKNKKMMYVSFQLYGNLRWGPFHVPPDEFYKQWQIALFEAFPEMIYKNHPKLPYDNVFIPPNANHVINGFLEKSYEQADLLVFDMFSGATCNVIASSKPIVYFNIGLRNLTVACQEALKSRCIWIDVDTNVPLNLYETLEAQLPAHRENNFSQTFSLSSTQKISLPRKQYISNVVEKMI